MSESQSNIEFDDDNTKRKEKFFNQSLSEYMNSLKTYRINDNNLEEIKEFVKWFIKNYPDFPNDESNYVLKWFRTAFYFYIMELYGNVVVETYSNLERFSINLLIEILSVYPEFKTAIAKLLEKKNLDELISIFLELKIIKEQNSKQLNNFLNSFKKNRNKFAHKNIKTKKKAFHYYDINNEIKKEEAWTYLKESIHIMTDILQNKTKYLPFMMAGDAFLKGKFKDSNNYTGLLNKEIDLFK